MASKKDMRRSDLIVPFVEPDSEKSSQDMSSTIAQSVPMAAMFTRQRMIGWVAVIFSTQHWLAETPDQKKTAATPGYLSVLMSVLSLMVCYLPFVMPPQAKKGATPAGAPPPVPPAH